jgi:hypothetical protein
LDAGQESLQVVEESLLRFEAIGHDEDGAIGDVREQGSGERFRRVGHGI